MKISDEILDKALAVHAVEFAATASYAKAMRAALLAVLPNIEKEIREECAALIEVKFPHAIEEADCLRSLPPSTQEAK